MRQNSIQIILGDPRHNTIGRHSTYLPCGLGYIANYTIEQHGSDKVSISIHSDIDELLESLEQDKPDILGLANYCWNAELGKMVMHHAKELNPDVICVGGGPEFPKEKGEVLTYMRNRNEMDFFVIQEGEVSFAMLIGEILKSNSLEQIKSNPQPGVYSLHPKNSKLVFATPPERLKNLDVIPSPFLSGMLDKFLDGRYMPFLETQRGCPYKCTYCHEGADWRNKVNGFSLERIEAELNYIAVRMQEYPDIPLAMSDSNFGMFKRDEVVAEYINNIEEKYGWPKSFIVDTGKSQLERIIRVALKLNKRMSMSVSPQSFNRKTLKAIKRTNLGGENIEATYKRMNEVGITTNAGIILPLPEETKESFLEGIKKLSYSKVEQPLPYTAMLLKGTEMASKEIREKYQFTTMYRMIPRNFGEYKGKKAFEIEELCVATNTMPYEDYLDCRGFMLLFTVLCHHQVDIFKKHTDELGLDLFTFYTNVWERVKSGNDSLTDLYNNYIKETDEETFQSPKELLAFYSDDENFKALLEGKIGDNLIRKYQPKMLLDHICEMLETGYTVLLDSVNDPDEGVRESLNDALKWSKEVRYITPLLKLKKEAFSQKNIELNYDVEDWYSKSDIPLTSFKGIQPFQYKATVDYDQCKKAIDTWTGLYGDDIQLWVSRLLESGHTTFVNFWYKLSRVEV